jgi:hypothetical protein
LFHGASDCQQQDCCSQGSGENGSHQVP